MGKIFVFLHGLYAVPFYLSVIAVIYNKILEFKYDSNNVICNNMQIKFFDDKDFGGFSPVWIGIDIIICMCELLPLIVGTSKYPSVYAYGWFLDLAIVCIIAIIYGIFYLKRKKENTLEIDIDIINEAIKVAPPGEIQKTLISARDRTIKQQRTKVVKEGIAAIDRI
mgnify:CR=1 FL=1